MLRDLRSLGGGVTRYLYVHDARGNIVGLTDTTGKLVDSYAYDPWGKVLSSSESVPQPFLYASYWYDCELGSHVLWGFILPTGKGDDCELDPTWST